MEISKYSSLVEEAKNKLNQDSDIQLRNYITEKYQNDLDELAKDLSAINNHIKVDSDLIDMASTEYKRIADILVKKLACPNDSIRIIPQGSSSTKTLIRSPNRSKFDIDAVCFVDASVLNINDPMGFFSLVGVALKELNPIPKKRCWKVDFSGQSYYIEFTPSTQLDEVQHLYEGNFRQPGEKYRETALAVVDTPSERWKTSNPEGFSKWVTTQSARTILNWESGDNLKEKAFSESVSPVPDQEVVLSDTLRVAIRLLKRHRDMSVHRNLIDPEFKPISIIIVTLLTKCYEGLADQGASYKDPIELLIDLVDLMPFMVEKINSEYWISNPTVEGENFAEKWNQNINLKRAFDRWSRKIKSDLVSIITCKDVSARSDKIMEVFGCSGADRPSGPTISGLTSRKPTKPRVTSVKGGLA